METERGRIQMNSAVTQMRCESLKTRIEDLENSLRLNKALAQEVLNNCTDPVLEQAKVGLENSSAREHELAQSIFEAEQAQTQALLKQQCEADLCYKKQDRLARLEDRTSGLEHEIAQKAKALFAASVRRTELEESLEVVQKSKHLVLCAPHPRLFRVHDIAEHLKRLLAMRLRRLAALLGHKRELTQQCYQTKKKIKLAEQLLKNPLNRKQTHSLLYCSVIVSRKVPQSRVSFNVFRELAIARDPQHSFDDSDSFADELALSSDLDQAVFELKTSLQNAKRESKELMNELCQCLNSCTHLRILNQHLATQVLKEKKLLK